VRRWEIENVNAIMQSPRHARSARTGTWMAVGMIVLFVGSQAAAQESGKRRTSESSEIPSAAETLGGSSRPLLDGKPLHPDTFDTPARKSKSETTGKSSGGPSILARMSAGTKRFFTSTRNMFRVRSTETKTQFVGQHTGWQQPSKPQKKESWFSSMFAAEKPEPETPQEWLSQPRPKMF